MQADCQDRNGIFYKKGQTQRGQPVVGSHETVRSTEAVCCTATKSTNAGSRAAAVRSETEKILNILENSSFHPVPGSSATKTKAQMNKGPKSRETGMGFEAAPMNYFKVSLLNNERMTPMGRNSINQVFESLRVFLSSKSGNQLKTQRSHIQEFFNKTYLSPVYHDPYAFAALREHFTSTYQCYIPSLKDHMRRQWAKRDIMPRNQLNPQLTSKPLLTKPRTTSSHVTSESSLITPQTAAYVGAVLVPGHDMHGSTTEDTFLDANPPTSSATNTTVKPSPPFHSPEISAKSPSSRNKDEPGAHSSQSPADDSPVPSTPSSSGSTVTAEEGVGEGAEKGVGEEDGKVPTDLKNATEAVPSELAEQSIRRLYKMKILGTHSPKALNNMMFHALTIMGVGKHCVSQLYKLRIGDLAISSTPSGLFYLELSSRVSFRPKLRNIPRLAALESCPTHCPVKAFETLLLHRPDEYRYTDTSLFLKPNFTATRMIVSPDVQWFRKMKMGYESISRIVLNIGRDGQSLVDTDISYASFMNIDTSRIATDLEQETGYDFRKLMTISTGTNTLPSDRFTKRDEEMMVKWTKKLMGCECASYGDREAEEVLEEALPLVVRRSDNQPTRGGKRGGPGTRSVTRKRKRSNISDIDRSKLKIDKARVLPWIKSIPWMALKEAATSSSHGSEKNSTNQGQVLDNTSAYQSQRLDGKSANDAEATSQSLRSESSVACETPLVTEKQCTGTGLSLTPASNAEHSITQQTENDKDPESAHLSVPSGRGRDTSTTQVKVEASEVRTVSVTDAATQVTSALEFVEKATQTDTVHLFSGAIKQEMLEPETEPIQPQEGLESTGQIHGDSCVAMFQVLNAKIDNLQRMMTEMTAKTTNNYKD